jgi:uncharacterized protein with von Willebrand factor type A (vWA) domain
MPSAAVERRIMAKNNPFDFSDDKSLDDRSRFTVGTDRWDREDYQDVRAEVGKLRSATDSLAGITPTARPEMADLFALFSKVRPETLDPQLVRDDHRVNLTVNEQVQELPEYRELRFYTRGDAVASAMAAVRIEPTVETLFDREKHRQQQAEQLQKQRDELLKKLQELIDEQIAQGKQATGDQPQGEGQDGDGDGQGQSQKEQDLKSQIEQLKQLIEQGEISLEQGLGSDSSSIQAALKGAMRDAADDAAEESMNARTWGTERGQMLRMPADERLKMAQKLNNPKLKRIAELFGPMSNIAFAPRQRRIEDIPHELSSVTLGGDLEHLLPEELLRLDDPDQEFQFLQDYADNHLMQYKMYGTEKVGKGGLVLCLDSSGSMSGMPELMSKAVMLCLLNICKAEDREFHLIHFGSSGHVAEFSFKKQSDYTMENIVAAAETFLNGGTSFDFPLTRAVDMLKEENKRNGRTNSDIVFLTDGQCAVTPAWQDKFHDDLHKLDAICWGIAVGCSATTEPLWSICEQHVFTVEDMTNAGKEIKEIFQGVQRAESARKS